MMYCKLVLKYDDLGEPIKHLLPETGEGLELIIHKDDGYESYDFCSIQHLYKWVDEQSKRITDDMVSE